MTRKRSRKTLDERIHDADKEIGSMQERLAELRKQKRQLEREAKKEAERKMRAAEQDEALRVLRWLKSNTFNLDGNSVDAYSFVCSQMNGVVGDSTSTTEYTNAGASSDGVRSGLGVNNDDAGIVFDGGDGVVSGLF